jgi:hypothetical protein
MPRFYLHIEDGDGLSRDGDGIDAPDYNAALRVSRRAAGQIVADALADGQNSTSFFLCLDDEEGARLLTLPVTAAIGEGRS